MANGIFLRQVSYNSIRLYINDVSVSSSSDEDGQERFLHQGRCRTHCPRGLYPDRGHYSCLPCIANCELCTDGNICAKCREHYKLHNGVCQTASCDMGKCINRNVGRRHSGHSDSLSWISVFQDRCRTPIQESVLTVKWAVKHVPQVSSTHCIRLLQHYLRRMNHVFKLCS